MAPVTFNAVCTYCGLVLCLLTVFFLEKVNSSASCVEEFVAGEDANTRYEYVVGERITLRCNVSARDPAKDMVYWKYDSLVFSQDDVVIKDHQAKYTVTLDNQTSIYTISWIAEEDDAGKYNCTCTTGGLQFPVWIKVPCNERNKVINDTTASKGTSQEVLDYLDNGIIPELAKDQSRNFRMCLDCGCTWPEVGRTFNGKWYTDDTEDYCVNGVPHAYVDAPPENYTIGKQDTLIKPVGCATKHAVTYRYTNVGVCFNLTFTSVFGMQGREYAFYIDEGQCTRPVPLMKFRCENCTDCNYCTGCISATIWVCRITGPIMAILCVFMIAVAVFLKVFPDKPGPPEETQITDILRTSAVVSWKPPIDDGGSKVTGYQLERRLTSSTNRWAVVNKKPITKLSFKDTEDVKYEKEYEYRVAAENMAGVGEPSYPSKKLTKKDPCDETTDAKSEWKILFAIIVYGCIIVIGAACLIALLVQSIRDAKCLISWSHVCPCSRCEFGLTVCEIIWVCIDGVFIVGVIIAAIFLLVFVFKRPKPRQNQPECRPSSVTPVSHNQIYPSLNGKIDHENETDGEKSPRKKNRSPLRKRQSNKVVPSDDEIEKQAAPSGQLSNMTPEKHPPPKLDPIITLPEGGDAPVDENGESPRKRKKKKKKSRHHRSPPQDGDTDPFVATEDTADAEQSPKHRNERTSPGYDDDEPKSTNDTSFNAQGTNDERFSERSRGLHRSEEPVPSVNLDKSNHNNYSEA